MDRSSATLAASLVILLSSAGGRLSAQSSPYAMLIGTWVMDSTTGADDKGLPKAEQLVFSQSGAILRITATTDDGKGASTSAFNCQSAAGGAVNDLAKDLTARCTTRTSPDSVMYALDIMNQGKTVSTERGRLVVMSNGFLRDQYDATSGTEPATHHRHIYHKAP